MFAHLLEAAPISRPAPSVHNNHQKVLSVDTEELANLRFSIVLTAKWEASSRADAERRNELRAELAELRRCYSQKIDDMAMTFGVQKAMDVKEKVERAVDFSFGVKPSRAPLECDDLIF